MNVAARRILALPPENRTAALRQYPLRERYEICRYALDRVEPPALDLIPALGASPDSITALVREHLYGDDLEVRDQLTILTTLESAGAQFRIDEPLLEAMRHRAERVKDARWRAWCLERVGQLPKE